MTRLFPVAVLASILLALGYIALANAAGLIRWRWQA